MTQQSASLAQILGRYEQTDNIAILFKYFFGFFPELKSHAAPQLSTPKMPFPNISRPVA